jgi:hypothetical protein
MRAARIRNGQTHIRCSSRLNSEPKQFQAARPPANPIAPQFVRPTQLLPFEKSDR